MQVVVPLLIVWLTNSISFLYIALWSFCIERFTYFFLKNTLKRKRPPDIVPNFMSVVIPSDKFSFPSGHTMAAFVLAGICTVELGHIATPLYLWALTVGSSRVILGVHFPSDILAGAAIGSIIVLCVST